MDKHVALELSLEGNVSNKKVKTILTTKFKYCLTLNLLVCPVNFQNIYLN